jgi:hypothetical protein
VSWETVRFDDRRVLLVQLDFDTICGMFHEWIDDFDSSCNIRDGGIVHSEEDKSVSVGKR